MADTLSSAMEMWVPRGRPDFANRWERARRLARESGVEALYVTSGANFSWLTGWSPYAGGYPIWLSCLLVPAEGDPATIISTMHANIVERAALPVAHVYTYEDGEDASGALRAAFRATGLRPNARIGVASNLWFGDVRLLTDVFPELRLAIAGRAMDSMRAIKDDYELEILRRSGETVDAIYQRASEVIRAGIPMAHVGLELMKVQLAHGSTHPKVGGTFRRYEQRSFAQGEIIDVDTGASFLGYSTDTARNVHVGDPSPKLREQYEVVKAAYDSAEAACKIGTPMSRVHEACASVISEAGYEQTWKVGHGVGLAEGHEAPLLQIGNEEPLEERMVFTIDPGFFVARDLPLHIERTVVVTHTGIERLDKFSHELIVV